MYCPVLKDVCHLLFNTVTNGAHPGMSLRVSSNEKQTSNCNLIVYQQNFQLFFTAATTTVGGRGISVHGGSLSRGSPSRGFSIWGAGGGRSLSGRPSPPYGYVRAVRILLECILVFQNEVIFILEQKGLD